MITFNHLLQPSVDTNALRFALGININIGPQQTLNTSNPWLNFILLHIQA